MFEIDNRFGIVYAFENLQHRHIVYKGKHIEHLPKNYVKSMLLCGSITFKTHVN